MRRKSGFLLLTRHTDEQITDYLQRNAEDGWALERNRGNHFFFIEKPYSGKRVCAYTFLSRGTESSTEEQLARHLVELRREGWDTICIGGPEDIADSKRHAFLYEEHPDAENPVAIPKSDENYQRKIGRRNWRKAFSNLLLCILYLAAIIFAVSNDLMRIVSSNLYTVGLSVVGLVFLACFGLSLVAMISSILAFYKPQREISTKRYRTLDFAARGTFVLLLALVVFLGLDSLYGSTSESHGVKTAIGNSTVRLYSDTIPVTLSDLGADVTGKYRSTVHQQSSGFLGSYEYCFDQCLGTEGGDVSFVSYTIFRSDRSAIFNAVVNQMLSFNGELDFELGMRVGAERCIASSDSRMFLLSSRGSAILIKSGFALSELQLSKLVDLI